MPLAAYPKPKSSVEENDTNEPRVFIIIFDMQKSEYKNNQIHKETIKQVKTKTKNNGNICEIQIKKVSKTDSQ